MRTGITFLTEPTWLPITTAVAVERLTAAGVDVPAERHALIEYALKGATSLVERWLAARGLALRRSRVSVGVGSEGERWLSCPMRPISEQDFLVDYQGEPLDSVALSDPLRGRLYREREFPCTAPLEKIGRFGVLQARGDALPDIQLTFWAGYAEGAVPDDLMRAIWITFKAAYEGEFREVHLAYKQGLKTALSYRKGFAVPEEAEQILMAYSEAME